LFFVIINLDDVMMLHHAAGKQTKRRMTTTADVIEMSNLIPTGNVFIGVFLDHENNNNNKLFYSALAVNKVTGSEINNLKKQHKEQVLCIHM